MAPAARIFARTILLAGAAVAGCSSPDAANIQLRKTIQEQEQQLATLNQQHDADLRRLAALERRGTTVPSLPTTRLSLLFTTHGFELGRLTGLFKVRSAATTDAASPRMIDAFRVFITPLDENAAPIKATGRVTVEAFDLAARDTRLGKWVFQPADVKKTWESILVDAFVLTCPLVAPPAHPGITLKVTFEDELTGRTYEQQKEVQATLDPADALHPSTNPSTNPAKPGN